MHFARLTAMTALTSAHVARRLLRFSIVLGFAVSSLAAIGLAGSLAGCQRVKRPYEATADPYELGQVQLADKELEGRLAFDPARANRDEAGLLHVTIPARATHSRPQIVQYRFTFFDEAGQPLPGGEYRTVTLESNTNSYLRGNSTSPRADDFQVEIRLAR